MGLTQDSRDFKVYVIKLINIHNYLLERDGPYFDAAGLGLILQGSCPTAAQTLLINNCLIVMFDALPCLTICPTKAPVIHLDDLFYQREADRDGLTSTILQPL
jgi:hypothetical protein